MVQATGSERELLILRHGKSDWSTEKSDFNRPMKNRGTRNAQQMGNYLVEQNLQPDLIISSPAERALTTAEKTCKAMGEGTSLIETNEQVYEASYDDLLQVLSNIPDKIKRILLVGHNPGLEDLIIFLANELTIPDDGKIIPTATLAHLVIKQPWNALKEKQAILRSITRPASLSDRFPVPTPEGIQYRIRPAYYYSQSAMIPYRIIEGLFEILLVRSSSHKHWIIPKGIIEPGLTPVESAEKEALEEAGVRGKRNNIQIGEYRVEKWGAECTVAVFALLVTHVLQENEWQESHRRRIWVSPGKAMNMIKNASLIPLFVQLHQQVLKEADNNQS